MKGATRNNRRRGLGVTMTDVVVVLTLCVLMFASVGPGLFGSTREQANLIKCTSNLRQVAMAALMYAQENKGKFPRTYFDPEAGLDLSTHGGPQNSPTNRPFNIPNPASPVGTNNVSASFYLLLRESDLPTETLICPSVDIQTSLPRNQVNNASNFPDPFPNFSSYSYSTPFATTSAREASWKFDSSSSSQTPLAADQNYGDNAKGGPTQVAFTATREQMQSANSANHYFEGQQIAYVDAHVEWSTTPFAGNQRIGAPWRDNIYASASGVDLTTGKGGIVADRPSDKDDHVLLPTSQDVASTAGVAVLTRKPGMSAPGLPTSGLFSPLVLSAVAFVVVMAVIGLILWLVIRRNKATAAPVTWGPPPGTPYGASGPFPPPGGAYPPGGDPTGGGLPPALRTLSGGTGRSRPPMPPAGPVSPGHPPTPPPMPKGHFDE